ncbi:hypothetical protein D9619_007932 [Psilocybe cf. subviscida]|uniref:Uncharacterized protein n=1 Tax=Psilocybe cf. subviscida TaxID=2480587 RepID=A0A8H5ATJ4_9AGAR|nr:hypothetical protein D9619_007932 [Psilocybe cf. subviscida]
MRSWLARSGNCPLNISFCGLRVISEKNFIKNVQELLLSVSRRWASVDFAISNYGLANEASFIAPLMSAAVPLLHSLKFEPHESSKILWKDSRLLAAPNLRAVTVNYYHLKTPTAVLCKESSTPWSRITSLSVQDGWTDNPTQHSFEPLRLCSMLVNLKITMRPSTRTQKELEPDTLGSTAPIHLPRLQVLHIHPRSAKFAQNLSTLLVTPALVELSYRSILNEHTSDTGAHRSAAGRNVCAILDLSDLLVNNRLRRLSLDPKQIPAEELYHLLEMLPGLEELSMDTDYYWGTTKEMWGPDKFLTDNFLRRLAGDLGDTHQDMHIQFADGLCQTVVLLPRLSTLTLRARMSFTRGVFEDFLRIRCQHTPVISGKSTSRLSAFNFGRTRDGYSHLPAEEMLAILAPFEEHGLEVRMRVYPGSPFENICDECD